MNVAVSYKVVSYMRDFTVCHLQVQGSQSVTKNDYLFYVFRTSTPFREKPSDHFKDLHQLKVLINFDVNLIISLGGVKNTVVNF